MKKTAKDVVEDFKGVWPYGEQPSIIFRISDERYSSWRSETDDGLYKDYCYLVCTRKEFEQEVERQKLEQASADWYDYDKQQATALPPAGVKIEFNYQTELTWEVAHVVAIHHFRKDLILSPFHNSGKLIYANDLRRMRPLDYNRKQLEQEKIKQETTHAALKAFEDFKGNFLQSFEHLYNIGALRPVGEWKK